MVAGQHVGAVAFSRTADPAKMAAMGLVKMAAMGLVKVFLAEAFKHGKAIGALTAAAPVLKTAHLPGVSANGADRLGVLVGDEISAKFIAALKTPRFRNRDVNAVVA